MPPVNSMEDLIDLLRQHPAGREVLPGFLENAGDSCSYIRYGDVHILQGGGRQIYFHAARDTVGIFPDQRDSVPPLNMCHNY